MTPEELLENAARADAVLVDTVKRAVVVGVMTGANTARSDHRFVNRTGKLERSIGWRIVKETERGGEGQFYANAPYASFVDGGTRPHEIRPRRAAALVFFVDGQKVVTQLVRHPGTRPEGFMGNATLAAQREMELEIRKGRVKAAETLVGG